MKHQIKLILIFSALILTSCKVPPPTVIGLVEYKGFDQSSQTHDISMIGEDQAIVMCMNLDQAGVLSCSNYTQYDIGLKIKPGYNENEVITKVMEEIVFKIKYRKNHSYGSNRK